MSNLITLTSENFKAAVLDSDKPVLVDFWATWCGPCRMMAPVFDEAADELSGEAVLGKVNVDEQPELASVYGVMSIPTIICFKNGAEVKRAAGARPKQEIKELLR